VRGRAIRHSPFHGAHPTEGDPDQDRLPPPGRSRAPRAVAAGSPAVL